MIRVVFECDLSMSADDAGVVDDDNDDGDGDGDDEPAVCGEINNSELKMITSDMVVRVDTFDDNNVRRMLFNIIQG